MNRFLETKVKGYVENDKLIDLQKQINDFMSYEIKKKFDLNRDISKSKCS